MVGGQEDMIVDVALGMFARRKSDGAEMRLLAAKG